MKRLPCPEPLWPEFSRLLDAALELDEHARQQWLDALPPEHDEVKPWLAKVLRPEGTVPAIGWLTRPRIDVAPQFAVDETVGPWRLLRRLGHGGMGSVWLARRIDGAYEREVALKLPHAHLLSGALRERFSLERDILAGLSHPKIARFYDAGLAENGQPWLTLEYIEGVPIAEYCETHRLSVSQRIELVRQVAEAVSAAHARLIVHRDLKPSNVLVTAQGEARLLDFGIAKLLDPSSQRSGDLTRVDSRIATPDYAAPEQLEGGVITVATDIYSLGVLLYELLTGERPNAGRSRLGRMVDSHEEAPLASSRVNGHRKLELRGDVDAILACCLQHSPADRYPSMEAFAADLGRHLRHEPIAARQIGVWQRTQKFLRRNRRSAGFAAALALLTIAGIGGVLWQTHRVEEEARRAGAIKDFLIDVFKASDPRIAAEQPRGTITARALLDASVPRIKTSFDDDPAVQIELLRTVADIYAQLGEEQRYESLQALQLSKARAFYGDRHPLVLSGEVEAAEKICLRQDKPGCAAKLAEADGLLNDADMNDSALRGWWHVIDGLRLLGEDHSDAEAQRAFERAIALYRLHEPRSRGAVTAMHELANFLSAKKQDHEAAIALFKEAAQLSESLPDRNDAELQTLYGNVGLVYQQLGRFTEAADAFRKSADIADRTTGATFPTAWVPRANAARTLHLAGERDQAHREFDKLLPLLPPVGQRSLEATLIRLNYGERLASEGRTADAIPFLEQALAAYEQQSAFSFQVRLARRYLGDAYARAGRQEDARKQFEAALADYLANDVDANQAVMAIRERWGRWLLDAGRVEEAKPHFETVVAAAGDRTLAHVALAHAGLARAALIQNNAPVALTESDRALAVWMQVTGFRDVRMGPYLQRVRAEVLASQQQLASAQQLEDLAAEASARYDASGSETRRRKNFRR
ncbi:protein kinase domain-containing protein [Steroidobacter sp.]|uniref:serine/threonine-protein kinase n=1 Tax=Steroidobacter sp. TaxID=1978227 RepID=UPI001A3EC617|nr:serine/threonine-protein kinase [Steroidobacter sp.]MBL8269671.1 protein kinase [Steroidobacter sp.]